MKVKLLDEPEYNIGDKVKRKIGTDIGVVCGYRIFIDHQGVDFQYYICLEDGTYTNECEIVIEKSL